MSEHGSKGVRIPHTPAPERCQDSSRDGPEETSDPFPNRRRKQVRDKNPDTFAAASETDEELACQAQAGSTPAFEMLVRRLHQRLYRFILQRVGVEADAEDLTQETFIRAYERLGQYRPRYRFVTWLFTIGARLAIARHRRWRPMESLEMGGHADDQPGPDERAADADQHRHVWSAARRLLSDEQVTLLWLFYVEEMPVREIARVLGRSGVWVKVSLFRSRQRLARELAAETTGRADPRSRDGAKVDAKTKAPVRFGVI